MADLFMGRCGIDCNECSCRVQMGCPGCINSEGKPFWGECRVSKCCTGKDYEHCGRCQEFPCDVLNEFSYASEHGDNGKRIRNLEIWNEMGYDAWRRGKNELS